MSHGMSDARPGAISGFWGTRSELGRRGQARAGLTCRYITVVEAFGRWPRQAFSRSARIASRSHLVSWDCSWPSGKACRQCGRALQEVWKFGRRSTIPRLEWATCRFGMAPLGAAACHSMPAPKARTGGYPELARLQVRVIDAPPCHGARQEPSFTAMFAGPAAGTPVRQGLPCFVAGWRRKAQAAIHDAARKGTALRVRSVIMPILSEVAPYDFRP
jgi:hypothetical protein